MGTEQGKNKFYVCALETSDPHTKLNTAGDIGHWLGRQAVYVS